MDALETLRQWGAGESPHRVLWRAGVSTESGIPTFAVWMACTIKNLSTRRRPSSVTALPCQSSLLFRFYREKMLPLGSSPMSRTKSWHNGSRREASWL